MTDYTEGQNLYRTSTEARRHAQELVDFYGPAISVYSRADAVRDELFFDMSQTEAHRKNGLLLPVHFSAELHARVKVEDTDTNAETNGTLTEILVSRVYQAFRFHMALHPEVKTQPFFHFSAKLRNRAGELEDTPITCIVGPNDDFSPLITFYTTKEAQSLL